MDTYAQPRGLRYVGLGVVAEDLGTVLAALDRESSHGVPSSRPILRHRVRYHEADAQGFLFNSRFLELADVAMTEFFRSLGFSYAALASAGVDPSVVSAAIQFHKPARFDDVLDVSVACPRVGRSSFDLSMVVCRESETVATIELTYVNVEAAAEHSVPVPIEIVKVLAGASQNLVDPPKA